MAATLSSIAAGGRLPVLTDVLPYLRCPVCRQPLTLAAEGKTVNCPGRHAFDLARAGYVPLTSGPVSHPGDTAAMVSARLEFLATGGYDFIADALAEVAKTEAAKTEAADSEAAKIGGSRPGLVIDVGAGTGHYLARVLDRLPGTIGLAVDTAKPALRRAARAHPRAGAVLADAWQRLPIADGVATILLNVFAPRNGIEFARVLAPDGLLLVVTPTSTHLGELAAPLAEVAGVRLLRIDPEKRERIAAGLARWFQPAGEQQLRRQLWLSRSQVTTLVTMGPSAAHTDPAALTAAVAALPEPVPVTASVRLARYRPHR